MRKNLLNSSKQECYLHIRINGNITTLAKYYIIIQNHKFSSNKNISKILTTADPIIKEEFLHYTNNKLNCLIINLNSS